MGNIVTVAFVVYGGPVTSFPGPVGAWSVSSTLGL
jgi:hypothetical protein